MTKFFPFFSRLTYKYSRLMDESHYKDGELPASEQCTLDEGEEEDEVCTHVIYSSIASGAEVVGGMEK